MKKILVTVAAVAMASAVHAAAVGWSLVGGDASFGSSAYQFFVIGQNGVESTATITALLDAGNSTSAYAFGSGTTAANGAATVAPGSSGKTLDAGTYTTFFVLFDSADTSAGKYAVVSGAATLTKTIADTTATMSFASGNQKTFLNNASNWKSYGAVPEPTSGLLMLLGMAGLALRRKRA